MMDADADTPLSFELLMLLPLYASALPLPPALPCFIDDAATPLILSAADAAMMIDADCCHIELMH